MGTKTNPGPFDCYANALPDEPMFTLLARDPRAPATVERWIELRARDIEDGRRPKDDNAMLREAAECAVNMTTWRETHEGQWKLPGLVEVPPEKKTHHHAYWAGLHDIIKEADRLLSMPITAENHYRSGQRDTAWVFKSLALKALREPDRAIPFLNVGDPAFRFEAASGSLPSPFTGPATAPVDDDDPPIAAEAVPVPAPQVSDPQDAKQALAVALAGIEAEEDNRP